MNICTITCQNADNHGARLQAYALAEYLRQQGHTVRVIDYRPDYMTFRGKMWFWPGKSLKGWGKLLLQWNFRRLDLQRHSNFVAFSERYIPLTKRIYYTFNELKDNPPVADLYICGSDQIWNTTFRNGTDPAYYLDFGTPATRRISYAASFATDSLREGTTDFVKSHLQNLNSISVRESSGLDILNGLGLNGTQVMDPVFLLPASHWEQIADEWYNNALPKEKRSMPQGEQYILVQDFMRDDAIRRTAQRIARLTGWRIWQVSPYRLGYADRSFRTAGPEQFLWLIRNARCVVSNSFHVTAFSLIFGRDAFVVNRSDGLNNRMADLLHRFDIEYRLVTADTPDTTLLQPLDYQRITVDIERQADMSRQWLNEEIENLKCRLSYE